MIFSTFIHQTMLHPFSCTQSQISPRSPCTQTISRASPPPCCQCPLLVGPRNPNRCCCRSCVFARISPPQHMHTRASARTHSQRRAAHAHTRIECTHSHRRARALTHTLTLTPPATANRETRKMRDDSELARDRSGLSARVGVGVGDVVTARSHTLVRHAHTHTAASAAHVSGRKCCARVRASDWRALICGEMRSRARDLARLVQCS